MLMHALAHGVRTDTVREFALKVDSGRKSLATPGVEPELAACPSDALPTELHPRLLPTSSGPFQTYKGKSLNVPDSSRGDIF